jgi:long-chain fatty acid transport protein
MTTPFVRTRIALAVAGVALALGTGQAIGAGFALQENSGSGLGNAYAGGAAAAEDAATLWSNVAGMSKIGTNQLVGAVNLIKPSMKFSNDGSIHALNQPLGNDGGDAGSLAAVPNIYIVVPINKQWTFGVGINAPFGLVTEYDDGWIGRYQALKSDVKTMNVNPGVSWKATDSIAIGAGFNYQQIKATFTSNVNYSAGLAQAAGQAAAAGQITPATANAIVAQTGALDAFSSVTGDDYGWGWNVGILADLDKNNRIGASWRSDIKYNISGNVDFSYPTLPALAPPQLQPVLGLLASGVNGVLANGGVTSDIKVPGIANVSWFGKINDRWDVMADVQWTHWSTIQNLTFVRTNGAVLQTTPENFKDVWRFAVGANYQYSDQWKFRGGLAYDQSPVQDQDRTARLPDSDRVWLAGGVQYAMSPSLKFDVGATYIWVKDGSIAQIGTNATSIATYGYLNGNYSNSVVVVSGQVTWSF